ncbi:MAG: hypothetical protein MZW92_14255 [Comamonadaceae bacterium]|nr:hypothetical protein [Comamonadaceae bacterium]
MSSASSCSPTSPEAGERDQWQDAFELARGRRRDTLTLLVRGAHAARRGAADGLRRHHRGRLGAALGGLGRGGAAAGARDQEPADADPALGRAAAAQARSQARRRRPGAAAALGGDHRRPGRRRCRRWSTSSATTRGCRRRS